MIVDADGLDALTMRRLGAALGVEAMSLYHHVAGKEGLLDGLVELIVLEIEVPVDEELDWREATRRVMRSYRRAALAHPHAFGLTTTRPLNTPEALRRVDADFAILRRAGLGPAEAIAAFRLGAGYVRGFALEEVTGRALGAQPVGGRDGLDPRGPSPEQFPELAELAPRLAAIDHDADFERGIETIIAGLEASLR